MKQLQALILAIAAAAGGWFARGTMLVPAPTGEHAAAPEGESKDEPGIKIDNGEIQLDPETAERLGIETLPVAALSWTSGVNAIGSVLDPAPLAALDGDIAAARSDLDAAQVELDRAEALFQNGENVPKKNVDTARAQLRAAQLKLQALLVRLPLEWGKLLETTDDTSRHALIERLVSRKAALIRIESVENSSLAAQATSAQLFAAGGSLTLERMVAAPSLNERTQAIAYLVLAVPKNSLLASGTPVTARLTGPGKAQSGVEVPASAVIRQGPQAWVYAETGPGSYRRTPILLTERTNSGWFLPEKESIKPGTKLVTTGAAALLSAELFAVGASEGEE